MYKILVETEAVAHLRQTPFRKIADPLCLLKEAPAETDPPPFFEVAEIVGRIHLYKDYQNEQEEDLTKPNLTANKIEIKTQALFINRLAREDLRPLIERLRERGEQIDTVDVVREAGQDSYVSLIVCLNSTLASEQLYQLVLFHFHVLPLYLQEATLALLPPIKEHNRECLALANPHLQAVQQQAFVDQQRWIELPRCPECLERLQYTLTGVSSSVLLQLPKPRPPCETCLTLAGRQPTACALCGSAEDNWICLVCSRVGCGRYKNGDAFRHFSREGHILTMDLQTQRVWNYLSDCFSHRVIPLQKQELALRFPDVAHRNEHYEQSLEAAFWEYCSVVTGELERQRAFYERQRDQEEERFRKEAARVEGLVGEARAELAKREEALRRLNKRNKKIERRAEEARESCKIEREILANYQQTIREQGREESLSEVEANSEKIQEKLRVLRGIDSEIECILGKLTQ